MVKFMVKFLSQLMVKGHAGVVLVRGLEAARRARLLRLL
eukprot:SAG22_NODE_1032_length_5924_cov_2.678283_2_plen_39_part_00